MAMDIPWHILKRKDLQPLERFTLSVLYLHATPDDLVVYPKNDQIIECTGLSSRAIARHMAKLERLGFIERVRKGSHKRDVRLMRGVPLASRDTSGTCHQSHAKVPPVAVDNIIGKNQLTNQVLCRPNGRPPEESAQLSIAEVAAEPPAGPKLSKREAWIQKQWKMFIHIHHQVQDRLIEAKVLKKNSSFKFTDSRARMLGTLYSRKYNEDDLFAAWVEMAKEAEVRRSLKYLRPATCFVDKNIDRSLEDRVNEDAEEPEEIADTVEPR